VKPLPPICLNNERYLCGPTCLETCDYKPQICTKDCRFGCFCQQGYVRKSNETGSPCVKREDCQKNETPRKCCKNQEFLSCGSSCPVTCDSFSFPLPKPVELCTSECTAGCFCKPGFYRIGRNRCVAPEKCCNGPNEIFNDCGSACPATCNDQSPACTKQCVRGCFCKSADYVRQDNTTNSPCIPRNECSE
jgi:hypothetical protein